MPKTRSSPRASRTPPASPELAFAQSPLGRRLVGLQSAGSASHRVLAEFVLRNPIRIAAWGIEDLARATDVSAPTISRFVRLLGLAGYSELRARIAETLQSMLQPVEKLRQTFERGKVTPTPLTQGLEVTLANLRGTAQSLEAALLAAIVQRLRRAPTVYVMGFGLSSHLAALLALDLQPFCRQLINVVEFGGTEVAAGRLMNIGARDLLIVISFPRYAKDAIQLTDYARDRGATVVAVTDSPASPLAQQSDFVLIAQSTHPVLSSSSAAAVLVIEALATSLMVSHRANATQAAKLTEAISAYMFSGASPARTSRRRAPKR